MLDKSFTVVAPYQFGELTDCYYWCKYGLEKGYKVTYIGYRYNDNRKHERILNGLRIVGVRKFNNRIIFGLCFIFKIVLELIRSKEQNIIVCRFPHAEILSKVFSKRNIILDIRTLSINSDDEQREKENAHIVKQMKAFKKCSIISKGTGIIIGVPAAILPLGADSLSNKMKLFNDLRFLYIGTFNNRHLDKFLIGFSLFSQQTKTRCRLDIVGTGSQEETNSLEKVVSDRKMDNVFFHGFLDHDQARWLFDECNVGICYVPITEYYQYQPPTKLYEYLLSGMACIATNTYSNKSVVNDINGVLVYDTPESVAMGLTELYARRKSFSSAAIINDANPYHWRTIFNNYFEPLLKR